MDTGSGVEEEDDVTEDMDIQKVIRHWLYHILHLPNHWTYDIFHTPICLETKTLKWN